MATPQVQEPSPTYPDRATTTFIPRAPSTTDYSLEVARGNVSGSTAYNKFGAALDCDTAVTTDIWDGADGTTSTDLWIPPTTARIHDIVSTSVNDNSTGTGARTIRVYGLTDWNTAEVSEDVTMNGLVNVQTVNSYVCIHRMKGLTWGTNGLNAGIITATAQTDGTVTAAIQAAENQTLMAILAIPSTQALVIEMVSASILSSGAQSAVAYLKVKEDATVQHAGSGNGGFLTKFKFAMTQDNAGPREFRPQKRYPGPCIAKMQVVANQNNTFCSGWFNGYIDDV